jgi:holo-[acyl-carrier protein] synthase
MIKGIGQDTVDVRRVARILNEYGERFMDRVFTSEEIAYCLLSTKRSSERFAARFAAKEAFSKAIGTGIRMGFRWREVSVAKLPTGRPILRLHGDLAARYGDLQSHLTISHTDELATAFVILESDSAD